MIPRSVLVAAVVGVTLTGCGGSQQPGPSTPQQKPQPLAPRTDVRSTASQFLGGTLTISPDEHWAVASDADLDTVWTVDLQTLKVHGETRFALLEDPGRAVIDDAG